MTGLYCYDFFGGGPRANNVEYFAEFGGAGEAGLSTIYKFQMLMS